MPVTECLSIFGTDLRGSTAVCSSKINICTWDLTAKNQQPNALTDFLSNTTSNFQQQTCEEGMATLWDREAPVQYLGQGSLNGQDYDDDEYRVCEARGSDTGR